MTREEGHALIDAAIRGEDVSPGQISKALRATGDIEANTFVQVVCPCGDWQMTGSGDLLPADVFDGLLQ